VGIGNVEVERFGKQEALAGAGTHQEGIDSFILSAKTLRQKWKVAAVRRFLD